MILWEPQLLKTARGKEFSSVRLSDHYSRVSCVISLSVCHYREEEKSRIVQNVDLCEFLLKFDRELLWVSFICYGELIYQHHCISH